MSPFFAQHAGMIELVLVEGIVLVVAVRELWSVRHSLRRPSAAERQATERANPSASASASASVDLDRSGRAAGPAGHAEGE